MGDKDDFQLLLMRFEKFEKFEPSAIESRIDAMEHDHRHNGQVMATVADQVRQLQSSTVQRSDLTKLRNEVNAFKGETTRTMHEIMDSYTSIFHANRKLTTQL